MQIISDKERDLKWPPLDYVEAALVMTCGFLLLVFTLSTLLNVLMRLNNTPILWLDELIMGAFIWGAFLGAAAAVRRNEHLRIANFVESLPDRGRLIVDSIIQIAILSCAACIVYFGYINFIQGFSNYLETTGTPIAVITVCIPIFGALTFLFSAERLLHRWKLARRSRRQPADTDVHPSGPTI